MELRPTRAEDIHELAAIDRLCFGEEAWSADQIHGSLALQTTYGWEAVEEGQIIGYVLAQRALDETEILTISVHPDFQRKGVGQTLLARVMENTGAGTIFLEVAADNVAAKALYEKCGFAVFGLRPGYYRRHSGAVDAVTYRYFAKS